MYPKLKVKNTTSFPTDKENIRLSLEQHAVYCDFFYTHIKHCLVYASPHFTSLLSALTWYRDRT
jgi:hypothetical protein